MALDANGRHMPSTEYSSDPSEPDYRYQGPDAKEYDPMSPTLTKPARPQTDWQKLFSAAQNQSAPNLNSLNPYADLGYQSFLRGYGLQQNQINGMIGRQRQDAEAQIQAQRPVWADALSRGLRNIGGNAEASGVFQSGQRLQNQNEFQVDQSRAQSGFESGIRGQVDNAAAQGQAQLLDLARQRAEQELAARQRLATTSIQSGSNPILAEYLSALLQG